MVSENIIRRPKKLPLPVRGIFFDPSRRRPFATDRIYSSFLGAISTKVSRPGHTILPCRERGIVFYRAVKRHYPIGLKPMRSTLDFREQ